MYLSLNKRMLALASCVVIAMAGCSRSEPAMAQLNLTPEQIKVMTPEQLAAFAQAQQQSVAPAAPAAQAPAAAQPDSMDPLAAGLLGAAVGAAAGGMLGNSMGKSSARSEAAMGMANSGYRPSYQSAPRTVINRTTVIKQVPAPAPQKRVNIGSVSTRPMASPPRVPSASKSFRSSSSSRRR